LWVLDGHLATSPVSKDLSPNGDNAGEQARHVSAVGSGGVRPSMSGVHTSGEQWLIGVDSTKVHRLGERRTGDGGLWKIAALLSMSWWRRRIRQSTTMLRLASGIRFQLRQARPFV
jgi:hypothetical protein